MRASLIKVGDVVRYDGLGISPYMTMTCYRIRDGVVYLLRPYVHVEMDVEIGYIGYEEIEFSVESTFEFILL